MLWVCLHFPDLPLAVFARADADGLPAVTASASHRPDVLVANAAARMRGIGVGLSIAAALALDPEIVIHLRDERAEASALERIALWAGQWTSTVVIESPACVLLEVSGALRYFGGLACLIRGIRTGLGEVGFEGVLAVAPTPGAASLLARGGCERAIEDSAGVERAISNLRIELLAHACDSLPTLASIGVEAIGDLLALPREGVARRFGQALLDELDRARGRLPDARSLFVAPERYEGQLELPAPVEEAEALLFGARRLAVELCGFLQGHGAGVTRLRCDLVHRDALPTSLVLGLTSTRQLEHIMTVLRERLARETLPDRVEAIRLVAEEIAPLPGKDRDFFAATGNAEAAPQLVERLRARLGEEAVRTLALHSDHRPGRAWRWEPTVTLEAKTSVDVAAEFPIRPLWLLPDPHRLASGPAAASLQLESGPERIESGWWDGHDVARDYFVARNPDGEALWLYRDREGQWFMHGVFA